MALRRRMRPQAAATAVFDGAFACATFACGYFDAAMWITGLVAFSMLAYWSYSRRVVLNRLRGAAWATQSGLAVAFIITILAGAYWLGLGVSGRI